MNVERLRVLVAGGYGYANMGDEGQLMANLDLWRQLAPNARVTVLTPNQDKTEALHRVPTELAPREVFFNANTQPHYSASLSRFKRRYFLLAPILLLNAKAVRACLPTFLLPARMAGLLDKINNSDLLFLSGGGFLTGKTLSRLWDNALLIRLAASMGVPTIMSGQTIGVFQDRISRRIARWGLKKAELIYVRDPVDSVKDLASIGIDGDKVQATFDDALFLDPAQPEEIAAILRESQIDPEKPYAVVNVHYWGQDPDTQRLVMRELAKAVDYMCRELSLQIVMVPMDPHDEGAIEEVRRNMHCDSAMPDHQYDPKKTVGLYRGAAICMTMKHHPIIYAIGGGVPTVSASLEQYYFHKNWGALKIFDLQDYAVHCQADELGDLVIERISHAWSRRTEITKGILARLESLRPHRGEVIRRWLESVTTGK